MEFIETRIAVYPDIGNMYQEMGSLYERKLWHQLTELLLEFTKNDNQDKYRRDLNMVELYENFISKFEAKINQVKFVQILINSSEQYCEKHKMNNEGGMISYAWDADQLNSALLFLENSLSPQTKKERLGTEAYIIAQMGIADLRVRIGSPENMEIANSLLEESKSLLKTLQGSGAEATASSRYHYVSAEVYKKTGPPDAYYESCLQYLAYTPHSELSKSTQQELAVNMALAALVGNTVFNFGEVLAEPVIQVLLNSEQDKWLYEMLVIFSKGDVNGFTRIVLEKKSAIAQIPSLNARSEFLKQKITLMCLMKMIFERPPEARNISFSEISEATRLPVDQVEWLLMSALSKGLIKGSIDEVDQIVRITWLKPRVLDTTQISQLNEKLKLWASTVKDTLLLMESETPELF